MLKRLLTVTICTGLLASCAMSLIAATKQDAKWKLGTPIVTYWAGPSNFMPLDDRAAAQIAAGGWNLGWAKTAEDLDIYYRHGIRAMLMIDAMNIDDPIQAKSLDALIAKVKMHPALYAYYVTDEPGAGAFAKLGTIFSYLRQRDPAHLAYINLFPTYATGEQLQVSDQESERARVGIPIDFAGVTTDDKTALRYREHLDRFIKLVQPELLSYDHYHFLTNSDGTQYFLNLALIRTAALEAKVPFLNIIQAMGDVPCDWRHPTEHEMRWLTYTSLAYGAQGISHFRYDMGFWKGSEAPQSLYWPVSRINRDFIAIATELQPLKSLGAYHCGSVPFGGLALPKGSRFAPDPVSQEILLGYFGKSAGRPTHVLVVNLNYKSAVSTTLAGPGQMDVFHAPTQDWQKTSGAERIVLSLPPGGGALVRLRTARR